VLGDASLVALIWQPGRFDLKTVLAVRGIG
jgi:hypothetical protein